MYPSEMRSAAGSAMAQSSAPRINSEIQEQRERLDRSLAILNDSLRELHARLETVLRPQAPEPTHEGNQLAAIPQSPGSDLGMGLAHARAQVETFTDGVQALLRRLAV